MSQEKEICEGCNHWKYTVVKVEKDNKKGILNNLVEFVKRFGM